MGGDNSSRGWNKLNDVPPKRHGEECGPHSPPPERTRGKNNCGKNCSSCIYFVVISFTVAKLCRETCVRLWTDPYTEKGVQFPNRTLGGGSSSHY